MNPNHAHMKDIPCPKRVSETTTEIIDEEMIRDFFDKLPMLESGEVFLMLGAARKKYAKDCPDITASHEVVTRELVRENDYSKFISKAQKTRAKVLQSRDKNSGEKFPVKSAVTWINPNPRDTVRAYGQFTTKMDKYLVELVRSPSEEHSDNVGHQFGRMATHLYSEVQKSPSRKPFSIADIDTKDKQIAIDLATQLEPYTSWVTETPGGYHVVYESEGNRIVYGEGLRNEYDDVEWQKDRLTHIWGVKNGGFKIRELVY